LVARLVWVTASNILPICVAAVYSIILQLHMLALRNQFLHLSQNHIILGNTFFLTFSKQVFSASYPSIEVLIQW